ncbi:MAG TPA: methyltransferase domain-containing protein [Nitrosopumilaceae archaeon]|nr:methyltransferase domain-containing protein [Nitrosopumilaceae archaeon]
MKIEDYLASLPQSIISGQDVQLPDNAFREIFRFVQLNKDDVFYHLGCGNGKGIAIALEEFGIKKAVGIDNDKEKISFAEKLLEEKKISNGISQCEDILESDISDATVILFWFSDQNIIEKMIPKFSSLKEGCRIITIWGPLPGILPDRVDFPYILNMVPFKKASSLQEQLLSVFGTDCIDFVVAWEFAERYTRAVGSPEAGNDRFLTILQSLVIWINAKNLGVACGHEIPVPIKNYISLLRTYFNIDVEYLLNED